MTDKQPDALRLADWLERRTMIMFEDKQAAAELRRLHQSEREGWRYAAELEQERKRLHEVNEELVESLREVLAYCDEAGNDWLCLVTAKAALTKATGENHD